MKTITLKKSQFNLHRFIEYLTSMNATECWWRTIDDYNRDVVKAVEYATNSYCWTYERKVARLFTIAQMTALIWMWTMTILFSIYECQWYSGAAGVTIDDYIRCVFYSAQPFALAWTIVSITLLFIWWCLS